MKKFWNENFVHPTHRIVRMVGNWLCVYVKLNGLNLTNHADTNFGSHNAPRHT